MTRTRGRRPLACHHEAGHAVARWWLGFHTDDAAVLTVDEARAGVTLPDRHDQPHRCEGIVNGYDIHMPEARRMLGGDWDSSSDRDTLMRQAAQRTEMALAELYAGAYAEARFMRRPAHECFLAGGGGDLEAMRKIAVEWFETTEGQHAAQGRADGVARALVRSPKGWTAMQAVAAALLDRGRIDGVEVDALCCAAYGALFDYDRWSEAWPPTPAQIRAGFLPPARHAANGTL